MRTRTYNSRDGTAWRKYPSPFPRRGRTDSLGRGYCAASTVTVCFPDLSSTATSMVNRCGHISEMRVS